MYVLDYLDHVACQSYFSPPHHRPPTNNSNNPDNLTGFWATKNRNLRHVFDVFHVLCIHPHRSCYHQRTYICYHRKKPINRPLNLDGETLEGLNINGTSRIVHVFLGRIWQPRKGSQNVEGCVCELNMAIKNIKIDKT